MNTTILQVPISKELRTQAASVAMKLGFSSLQETVRIFLKQLASEEIKITFESKPIILSAKNDTRYAKMLDDVKKGKVKTKKFSDVQKLMNHLSE